WPPGILQERLQALALLATVGVIAGLVVSAWAVSMRQHQTTMPAPATCARILGSVALLMLALGAFGLANRERTYAELHPKGSFMGMIGNQGPIYPVAGSVVVIALGV